MKSLDNIKKTNNLILGRIGIVVSIQIFIFIYSFIYSHKITDDIFNLLTIVNIFAIMCCIVIFKVVEKDFNVRLLNLTISAFDTAYIASIIFMTGYNKSPFMLLLPIYIFFTSLVFRTKGVIFSTSISAAIVIINHQLMGVASGDISYAVSIGCIIVLFGIITNHFVEKNAKAVASINTLNKLSRVIIDNMELGIIAVNKLGFVSYTNRTAEKILGDKETISGNIKNLIEAGSQEPHKTEIHPGYFIFIYNIPVNNGAMLVLKDISQDERMDKLQFVSTVASILAHEIKNPVSSIAGVSELIRSDRSILSDESNKNRLLGIIDRESERLTNLAEEFLIYSGSEKRKEEPVNIVALIQSSCDNIRSNSEFLNKKLKLELVSPGNENCIIHGDYQRISQAVENILINSIQASKNHDTISCAVACDEKDIVILISDTGKGIPEKIREKIFEPFFTTKEKGTGLGLAITRNIIKAHNGIIALQDSDTGTTFKIIFKVVGS